MAGLAPVDRLMAEAEDLNPSYFSAEEIRELQRRFANHPMVGDVRGVGMVGAIELVEDKTAKKNFDPARKIGPRLVKHGEEQGVILRAMMNDSIGFSPPLVITKDEVTEMLDRVERSLDALSVELRREAIAAV